MVSKTKLYPKNCQVGGNDCRPVICITHDECTFSANDAKTKLWQSGSQTGQVLPIQSVWKGATSRSLPTKSDYAEAKAAGHRFAFNRDTHWSSLTTTQQWINEILLPYRTAMIQEHSLSLDTKMILYIDCWTVHRSKEFRDWAKETHPELILIFVPAGCTGIFQPCDVGLQRLFKHNIKKSASEYFVAAVQR